MAKPCFYCGGPATSVDHVPPRCFFPKDKDLPADVAAVRKNLITVPACDAHNGKYSSDDEIASLVVRLPYQANALGQQDFLKKGFRTIEKSKGVVPSLFQKIEVLQLPDGREVPTIEFDAMRVNRVMERVARGLFFHDFGRCWTLELSVVSDGPLMPDLSLSPMQPAIRALDPCFSTPTEKARIRVSSGTSGLRVSKGMRTICSVCVSTAASVTWSYRRRCRITNGWRRSRRTAPLTQNVRQTI